MNHLAHAVLAETAGVSVAGSFAGDFVRGPLPDRAAGTGSIPVPMAPDLLEGVRFHRAVDAFTDAHPIVSRAMARFAPPHRRWAGVLVDVWFDHVLASDWAAFHPEGLESFSARVVSDLQRHRADLPARAHPFLDYVVRENLLLTYRDEEGVIRALEGMARRIRRENPLASAIGPIRERREELSGDFREYFPQVQAMARAWSGIEGAGGKPRESGAQ